MKKRTIEELRRIHGYTQKQTADALGITERGYAYKISGERSWKAEELVKLAELFNVSSKSIKI